MLVYFKKRKGLENSIRKTYQVLALKDHVIVNTASTSPASDLPMASHLMVRP